MSHLCKMKESQECLFCTKWDTPKLYQIKTTRRFDLWFKELKDRSAKARIQMRIDRVESGHFGDCEPVGNGISEWKYPSQAVMCCE